MLRAPILGSRATRPIFSISRDLSHCVWGELDHFPSMDFWGDSDHPPLVASPLGRFAALHRGLRRQAVAAPKNRGDGERTRAFAVTQRHVVRGDVAVDVYHVPSPSMADIIDRYVVNAGSRRRAAKCKTLRGRACCARRCPLL